MGLSDFFKKKNTVRDDAHISRPERSTIVPIEKVQEGKHGDHWAGLFGFNRFYNDKNVGREMLAGLMHSGKKTEISGGYYKQELDHPHFTMKLLGKAGEVISSFPVIKTKENLPTQTKVIKEWSHVGGMEAQVEARGKNTFGLSYFATDYLENKNLYQSRFDLDIQLSGIAYSAGVPPAMENMSPDFVGYLPNKELGRFSVLDFVGKILELDEFTETAFGIHGYCAKLRLIQLEEDENFFVVDTFINKESVEVNALKAGDRIAGSMWLQGKIRNA
ncbi:MAG TPA: hypothetical protein VL651_01130 [Bacteroidia bacterium]|jgi:hypothetical protein|nr:hypothetical protein [Bacteroidia bacterium]